MKKAFCRPVFLLFFLIAAHVSPNAQTVNPNAQTEKENAVKASITRTLYGEVDGKTIYQYILSNSHGMMVKAVNYGAAITDIVTPDKTGTMASIVLGFDSLAGYTGKANALMGAVVGRVANRIANRRFELDGKAYTLSSNIHGGKRGFDKRIWEVEEVPGNTQSSLKFTYFSKDGEEGFPGNLNVIMTYTLTNNNELTIDYSATTDKATPVVLTNHTYFNLSGGKDGKIVNTELAIMADQYLESDREGIPTGNFIDVKATPFDFRSPQKIGARLGENNLQLKLGNGYDITFALNNPLGGLSLAATAFEPLSGRLMQVFTTEPGVVFYTGNYLDERATGRGGKPFTKQAAFCLETQHFPNSVNEPTFPNTILRPGEKFSSRTVYKFSARK